MFYKSAWVEYRPVGVVRCPSQVDAFSFCLSTWLCICCQLLQPGSTSASKLPICDIQRHAQRDLSYMEAS